MKKKILFIDQDGTLVKEPPTDYQLDAWGKLDFMPGVFTWLGKLAREKDYELVLVSNQDGLGGEGFPEEPFMSMHQHVLKSMESEGVRFTKTFIDRSFPEEKSPNRKPETGMLTEYFDEEKYDLENSFVIGDRVTDMQLAVNLGARGVFITGSPQPADEKALKATNPAYVAVNWEGIYNFLKLPERKSIVSRKTKETQISIVMNLDGSGKSNISTGIRFFDHMLEQLSKHGLIDLDIMVAGDLDIDEHHTIEDTALALGEAFKQALGNKIGMERYGFCLPMDDCLCQVALDFGGRPWLVWEADFKREKIGEMPTEMFMHFFKSFSDAALCNLNIKAEGDNEHHKIEGIFKAWAKAIKMSLKRSAEHMILPSTKGTL